MTTASVPLLADDGTTFTKAVTLADRASTPLMGARAAPFGAYNTVAKVQAQMGTVQIGRVFHDGGLPANWSSTLADSGMVGADPRAGCVVSTKVSNGNHAAYIASIPAALLNAGKIYFVWHHEPEGDYATGAAFVAEFTAFRNAIKAIDPRVKVGHAAEGDHYGRYALAEATAGNYLPPASSVDFYSIDLYHPMNGRAAPVTADPETVITLDSFVDWSVWWNLVKGRGKPILITEWGMYAEPDAFNTGPPNTTNQALKQANRATMIPQWYQRAQDLCAAAGVPLMAVLFWYVDGKSGENGTFRPTDAASIAALAGLARGAW